MDILVYAWRIYVFSCSSILNSVRYYPFGGGVHVLKEGVSMYENWGCPCMTLGVSFYEDPMNMDRLDGCIGRIEEGTETSLRRSEPSNQASLRQPANCCPAIHRSVSTPPHTDP